MATATPTPTPIGGEETAQGWNLPTDVFVEILLLLPAIVRWRFRLVCRHWHDVIRERTPAMDNPVPLAFVVNYPDHTPEKLWASAHAIDDLAEGRCREAWRSKLVRAPKHYSKWERRYYVQHDHACDPAMVGTCNGLVCLCDDARPGGSIVVANPATGERLVVPPLPGSAQWVRCWDTGMFGGWHEAYSFAYHPGTAQYKVLHVPCYLDRSGGFSELQVFTLGQPSWRDVAVTGVTCRLEAGIVSLVHGVTHWITKDTNCVVSFDVKEERITAMSGTHWRHYWLGRSRSTWAGLTRKQGWAGRLEMNTAYKKVPGCFELLGFHIWVRNRPRRRCRCAPTRATPGA